MESTDIQMPHSGHVGHVCFLQNLDYLKENLAEYKKLVRDGRYVCRGCGRVAAEENRLCAPERL